MDGVSFDDEQQSPSYQPSYAAPAASAGGVTGMFIKIGLAKTAKEANMVMLIVTISFVALSVAVWVFTGHSSSVTPEMLRETAWMKSGHVGRPPADFTATAN